MHAEIDFSASSQDLEQLRAYINDNAEAREYYDNLQNVAKRLSSVTTVEPPADLKSNVMREISSMQRYASRETSMASTVIDSIRSLFTIRYGFSYAVGVATCLVLMAFVFYPGDNSTLDDGSGMTGTLILDPSDESYTLADSREFEYSGVSGVIESRTSGEVIMATVRVTSVDEVWLELVYDKSDLAYRGTGHDQAAAYAVEVEDNRIRIRHQGINAYILLFSNLTSQASDITLRIESGTQLFQETILTSQ
jgi:hypothetical protein